MLMCLTPMEIFYAKSYQAKSVGKPLTSMNISNSMHWTTFAVRQFISRPWSKSPLISKVINDKIDNARVFFLMPVPTDHPPEILRLFYVFDQAIFVGLNCLYLHKKFSEQ